jgi:hypothetical protein
MALAVVVSNTPNRDVNLGRYASTWGLSPMNKPPQTIVKPGDRVRLIKIPEDINDAELKRLFEQCMGKVFPVGDVSDTMVDLEIGELSGRKSYMESIYIEHDCIERVSDD